MAVITDTDLRVYWRQLYRKGEGKEEIKADGLMSPTVLKAIFQALDDSFENQRNTLKGVVNGAAGRPVSDAAFRKYLGAWMRRKGELE